MPYSITTKDGITINNIPDDVPQDSPDLKARVARARAEGGGKPAAVAPPPMQAGADDPGSMMAALIGAGRTTDQIIDGMKQLGFNLTGNREALDKLATEQGEKAGLYKPLQEQHSIATAIGEAAPGLVIPVGGAVGVGANVARLAAAGALPGVLEYGSAGERAGRAAVGGASGVVGGVVAPAAGRAVAKAVPAIGRTAKAIAEPLYAGGRAAIAGRTLTRAAGDSAQDVIPRMANATQLVVGSAPTAGQVAENGGIAALERAIASKNPADFGVRGMEQAAARTAALRGIAGDDVGRAAAVAARKSTSAPLYNAAAAQEVPVDKALSDLLGRPSVQKAFARAEKIAQEEGRAFGFAPSKRVPDSAILDASGAPMTAGYEIPGKVSGQTLQDLKMGMDALLKDPTSGIAGKEADLVAATRGQLMNWMEGRIGGLKDARTTYRDLSKPINQMDIGKNLLDKLEPALNDYGGLAKETGAKYALGLRNADQTARQATGFKGAGMADIMEPQQMQVLEGIAGDLARKANAQELGKTAGSNTFQNFAMDNIASQSGSPGVVGGILNAPGVGRVSKFLYAKPEEEIQSLIAKSILDPQFGAGLMQKHAATMAAPNSFKDVLFANPARATQLLGGGAGMAAGNLFAQ